MINWFKPFKLIFCFFVVVGLVFFTRSITSFASTTPSYDQTIYKSFYQSITGGGTYNYTHEYVSAPTSFTSSFSFGSNSGIHGCQVEVYFVTTAGSYLIASGSSNSYSVTPKNVYISGRYFEGFACGYLANLTGYYNGSSFISSSVQATSTMSGSAEIKDITVLTDEAIQLTIIESNTNDILRAVQNIDISTLESLLTSILAKVTTISGSVSDIYYELIDVNGSITGVNSRLTDIYFSLLSLKKSLCFDFPLTIDGNYQLSTVFFNSLSSNTSNDNPLSFGYCGFDFSAFYNCSLVVRVPESHKLLFIANRLNNGTIVYPNTFKDENGNSFSISYNDTSRTSSSYELYIDLPSSLNTGSFISFDVVRNDVSNPISVRFAIYDYVVSANDILNYMKDQWSQSSSAVSDLGGHSSNTGDMQVDVFETESNYFGDFESAVSGAGINGFSWSVFGGMTIFSAIVGSFYNLMPSEFALYITAVLIVGCIAVFLSAIGRVIKKGGSDG